ncbi:MAG: glutaredoxin family protein, partial [Burkholderiales bacterium]|nr:glutaredoxin family protein [Burkholderiales bacterium]
MIHFTLYSRSYCHLCDDMLEQLQSYSSEYAFTVQVVDVDTDDELQALYDELVPVLMGKKGQ